MRNTLYENFKRHFPVTVRKVVEWHSQSEDEIFARLNDGNCIIYDDMYNTVRNLPSSSEGMSEEECRYEFGRRLRRLMIRKGVSQSELSDLTGIQQSQISKYITGKTSPSFYNADKIAKALNCSTDIFRYID